MSRFGSLALGVVVAPRAWGEDPPAAQKVLSIPSCAWNAGALEG